MKVMINGQLRDLSNCKLIHEDATGKVFFSEASQKFIVVLPDGNGIYKEKEQLLKDFDAMTNMLKAVKLIPEEKINNTANPDTVAMVKKTLDVGVNHLKLVKIAADIGMEVLEDNQIISSIASVLDRIESIVTNRAKEFEEVYNKIQPKKEREDKEDLQ